MFGNQEVTKYNPNPAKGRRYLLFTILMVIILSIIVIRNAHTTSLADIAKEQIKSSQDNIFNNNTVTNN